MFSASAAAIFVAGAIGAATPIMFGNSALGLRFDFCRGWVHATAYVLLAGYVAAFVFEVPAAYQAFLMGLGLDSLLRSMRSASLAGDNSVKLTDGEHD